MLQLANAIAFETLFSIYCDGLRHGGVVSNSAYTREEFRRVLKGML